MPKVSIEYIIHFTIILHELCTFSYLSTYFGTSSKSCNTKPINCVGVQTFEHLELKFTNVRMLKFHIRLIIYI